MAFKCNRELTYTFRLRPGIVPSKIGQFLFNTCNTQSFDVGHLIGNYGARNERPKLHTKWLYVCKLCG